MKRILTMLLIGVLLSCTTDLTPTSDISDNDNFLKGTIKTSEGANVNNAVIVLYSSTAPLAKMMKSESFDVIIDSVVSIDGTFEFDIKIEGYYSLRAFVNDSVVAFKDHFKYSFGLAVDIILTSQGIDNPLLPDPNQIIGSLPIELIGVKNNDSLEMGSLIDLELENNSSKTIVSMFWNINNGENIYSSTYAFTLEQKSTIFFSLLLEDNFFYSDSITLYIKEKQNITNSSNLTNISNSIISPKYFYIMNYTSSYKNIFLNDIDSDGDIDVIANSFSDPIIFHINSNVQEFTKQESTISELEYDGVSTLTINDFDNDSHQDFIIAKRSMDMNGNSLELAISEEGKYSQTTILENLQSEVAEIESADFDNDGDNDIAIMINSKLLVGYNTSGTFNFDTISTSESIKTIHIKDFDGNGSEDIIISNSNDYSISVLFNNEGVFTKETIWFDAEHISKINSSDWDNDGDIDLLLLSDSGILNVLINNNGTSFTLLPLYTEVETFINSVVVSDINENGFDDIIALNYNKEFILFLNENGTTYSYKTIPGPTDYAIYTLYAADLDNNEIKDILFTGSSSSSIGSLQYLLLSAGE